MHKMNKIEIFNIFSKYDILCSRHANKHEYKKQLIQRLRIMKIYRQVNEEKKLKLHSNRPSVMPMENQKELKKISLTGSILNLNTYNLRLLILEKKE